MSARRSLFAIVALTAIALTACVPEPATPASPSVTPRATQTAPTRAQPEFRALDGVDIPGLHPLTDGDNGSLVYAVIPQIDGYDTLNGRLRSIVAADKQEVSGVGTDQPDNSRGFVNVSWRTLGSGSDIVGFLISSVVSPGASSASREDSVWFDATDETLLGWRDFVDPAHQDDVIGAVVSQLERQVVDPDLVRAMEILRSGDPVVGFSAEGALIVGFDEYDVAAGSEGAPMFEVNAPSAWLTQKGIRARQATLEPNPLVAAPEPEPEPTRVDCRKQRCVAITFDDGPSGRTTAPLLDVLAAEGVPATFFVLGVQAQAYPKLLKRMVADGHEIGNHTWSHPDLTRISPKAARKQIERTARVIEKATGQSPDVIRPPYGARNKKVDTMARKLGYAQVLWSIDTRDWANHSPKKIVAAVKKARPGSIILMHDIHPETVDAVPRVIAALRKKGFTLVTVSDLVGPVKTGKRYYGNY